MLSHLTGRMVGVKSIVEWSLVVYLELPLRQPLCGIAFWEAKRGL
jgi:hypothetical protein